MTIIMNEPLQTESTGITGFDLMADTLPQTVWTTTTVYYSDPLLIPASRTFADERQGFQSELPMLLSRYPGQWVAIYDGRVVEHDRDRRAVTHRFFANHKQGPVYIGFVGSPRTVRQATPFRARPRA